MAPKFITKLREKPEDQKKMIALVSAILITGVVVAVWLVAVINGDYLKSKESSVSQTASSPFESAKNIFKNIFQGETEIFDVN